MTTPEPSIAFGMMGDSLGKEFFLVCVLIFLSVPPSFSQRVLLLINESESELVVMHKRNISDILTLDHEYLGDAKGISKQGLMTQRKNVSLDSVHSLVAKHGNIGAKLGFPLKVIGSGLALVGGLVIWSSKESSEDAFAEEDETNLGRFVGGGALLGIGAGLFHLGNKAGDRAIENDKTTYYLHQWKTIITDRKNIQRYKDALEK